MREMRILRTEQNLKSTLILKIKNSVFTSNLFLQNYFIEHLPPQILYGP